LKSTRNPYAVLVSVPQRVLVRPLWGGLKRRAVRRLEERDLDAGFGPHAAVPVLAARMAEAWRRRGVYPIVFTQAPGDVVFALVFNQDF